MKKTLRIGAAALCLLLCAYFLLPLAFGDLHIGMIYPAAIFALLGLGFLLPGIVRRLFRGKLRRLFVGLSAALGTVVACILAVCVLMAVGASDRVTEDEEVTVIVLGCQVNGERPSVMLRDRIDAAYAYLKDHPDVKVIAAGGKGSNENISEAECIRRELMARGIDESRIYVEDRSVNTAENMAFSAEIVEQHNLCPTLAVASDNFHQLRASIFAARNGLDTRSLGCRSVWYMGPGYWAREVMALGAAFVRGY